MKLNKTKSIVLLVVTLILIAALGMVSAFGVGMGIWTDSKYSSLGSAKNIKLGLDLEGGVSITYQVVGDTPTSEELQDTINKLYKRAEIYSAESAVYSEGDDRIVVEIPGEDDAEEVTETLGSPGSLQLVTDYGEDGETVWLEGYDIEDAQAAIQSDSTTGATQYVVKLQFTDEGTEILAQVTSDYYGDTLSIVYDGELLQSPYIQAVISNGQCVITGQESYEAAEELASMIRIGSLSVELESISSNVIGAKLGDTAIESSLLAGLIGLIIVIIFMIVMYRIPGIVAGISIGLYAILELLVLNAFDLTLTLPGIAGIVLSIGMAVDSNIIIYARIREELANGLSVKEAISVGFKKSTAAIVDGNITTFIAGLVLIALSTGTVKGFAETLLIGIILTLFNALIFSKFMMNIFYNLGVSDPKFYGKDKQSKTIDFLKHVKVTFAIPAIILVAGIVTMVLSNNGVIGERDSILNYSVEFAGGTSISVDFEDEMNVDTFNSEIKDAYAEIAGTDNISVNLVDNDTLNIRTTTLTEAQVEEIKTLLVSEYGAEETSFEVASISATVGKEMRKDAIIAVIIAVICMLIYIFIRFRNLKFAASAVIALIHDVAIVFMFYVFSWISVGNTFIACMLTILGYSINATIVIFDRIRENLKYYDKKKGNLKELVNKSITQTLTRSIYTTFTTFIMVFMLSVLGVSTMREFSVPLSVGVICGAYSSVFITGALWYLMSKKKYEE